MNQIDTKTETITLADLPAQHAEEIKGGPKRIFIGGLSVGEAPLAAEPGSAANTVDKLPPPTTPIISPPPRR